MALDMMLEPRPVAPEVRAHLIEVHPDHLFVGESNYNSFFEHWTDQKIKACRLCKGLITVNDPRGH